jgi:hypothetical protein
VPEDGPVVGLGGSFADARRAGLDEQGLVDRLVTDPPGGVLGVGEGEAGAGGTSHGEAGGGIRSGDQSAERPAATSSCRFLFVSSLRGWGRAFIWWARPAAIRDRYAARPPLRRTSLETTEWWRPIPEAITR